MKFEATLISLVVFATVGAAVLQPVEEPPPERTPVDPFALQSHGPYKEDGVDVIRAGIQALNGTRFDCGHGMEARPETLETHQDAMLLRELDAVMGACWGQIIEPLGPSAWRNTPVAREAILQGKAKQLMDAYLTDAVLAIQAAVAALDTVEPGSPAEAETHAFLMSRTLNANKTLGSALDSIASGGMEEAGRLEGILSNLEFALVDSNAIRHIVMHIPWSDGSCEPPADIYQRAEDQMDAALEAAMARDPSAEDVSPWDQFLRDDFRADLRFYESHDWWAGAVAILYGSRMLETGWTIPPLSHPNEVPWDLATVMVDSVLEHNRTMYWEHLMSQQIATIIDPSWSAEVEGILAVRLLGSSVPNPFLTVCS